MMAALDVGIEAPSKLIKRSVIVVREVATSPGRDRMKGDPPFFSLSFPGNYGHSLGRLIAFLRGVNNHTSM